MEQSDAEKDDNYLSSLLADAKSNLLLLEEELKSGRTSLFKEEAENLRTLTEMLMTLRKAFIIALLKGGTTTCQAAKIFGVTPARISQIKGEAR